MAETKDGTMKRELGISRRDLLRRGAVVGGTLVWAAPVIQSLGPKAFAQGAVPATGEVNACCFCFNSANNTPDPITAEEGSDCSDDGPIGTRANEDSCKAFCATAGYDFYQWGAKPGPVSESCGCQQVGEGPRESNGCGTDCQDAVGSTA